MSDAIFGLIIGLIGGFAGGLLGIGGGAIYVPAMVLLLGEDQHIAQGASLAAIVGTAIVGALTHLRRGNVDVPAVAWVTPPAVIAGFGAALLADVIEADALRRIFAVVMLGISLTTIYGSLRGGRAPVQQEENS
ncbi:MAG: sulfite exporter TauE/SafE family protein [Dehalococcoidia bacterium]